MVWAGGAGDKVVGEGAGDLKQGIQTLKPDSNLCESSLKTTLKIRDFGAFGGLIAGDFLEKLIRTS